MSFKENNQDQLFLLPPSLHEFLPADHLAHVINEVVHELDLRELYDRYSDLGSSAYHPQMMLKVLFYGYAMGERSSRVIAHRLRSDVAYMYLSALQQPDFRTINRFRKENIDLLKGLFIQVVRLCREMGMVSVGRIAIDSTKLKANASYRRTKRSMDLHADIVAIEKEIESILRECEEIDSREDEQMGEDQSIYEVVPELKDKQQLREKLRKAREKLSERGAKEINLTDEEATTMLHWGYSAEPSYNGHIAVEESHGVLVAADLSNNPADYEALVDLLEETEKNIGEKQREVLGDSGYSSYENLRYLEEKTSLGIFQIRGWRVFVKERINILNLIEAGFSMMRSRRGIDCAGCERRLKCTKAESRSISQDPREFLMERMRTRLGTEEGKAKYGKRKYIVEPVFGDMKQNRNMRGLWLRGKREAKREFLIMCIAHNLKKIAKYLKAIPPSPELQPLIYSIG